MNMKVKREVKLVLPHDFDDKLINKISKLSGSFISEIKEKEEQELLTEIHRLCHQAFKLGLETNV